MVSFAQLWEQIEVERSRRSPLMGSGDEDAALRVIRVGKELHNEDETPFWDEFITVCGNVDGLAELLGIGREKISSWPARIREHLNKLEKQTAENPAEKPKAEVMPTGDNGGFNVDPNLGAS